MNMAPRPNYRSSYAVGRIVSKQGYRLDPKNVDAIRLLKETPPKTVGEVRKLLGTLGYYHRYIPDFARVAKPVFDLLKNKHTENAKGRGTPSGQPITWSPEHLNSLSTLVDHLSNPPILAYPNVGLPYL